MTFSSAYLFAKQITRNTPRPTGNVYFENGQFNEQLAYSNTDFATKTVYRDDFAYFNNYGGIKAYDLIKDNIGDGKIYEFLGTNAGEILLSGSDIVCDIANPNTDPATRFNTDFGVVFLPIRLPANTYSKVCATFEMTDKIDDNWSAHLYTNVVSIYNRFAAGVYIYGSTSSVTPGVEFTLKTDSGNWYDNSPYIGIATGSYQHVEVSKIWFE